MKKKISEKVLDRIKEEKIKPSSRIWFFVKKWGMWVILGLSMLFGGVAMGVVLFMIFTHDWNMFRYLGGGFFRFFFISLPYFWLVLLGVFLYVAYIDFRRTEEGYRYRFSVVLGAVLGLSLFMGLIFFGTGLSKSLERTALLNVPFYKTLTHDPLVDNWSRPSKGLLAGKVEGVRHDDEIILIDFNGKEWSVIVRRVPNLNYSYLEKDVRIKLFGEVVGQNQFDAVDLRLWRRNFIEGPRSGMREVQKRLLEKELR